MKSARKTRPETARIALKRPVTFSFDQEPDSPVDRSPIQATEQRKIPMFDLPRSMTPAMPDDDITFEWQQQEPEEFALITNAFDLELETDFSRLIELADLDMIAIET